MSSSTKDRNSGHRTPMAQDGYRPQILTEGYKPKPTPSGAPKPTAPTIGSGVTPKPMTSTPKK